MNEFKLPSQLENAQRILVAGAGGGFDVLAGLPIFKRLRTLGRTVSLANLSFVDLGSTSAAPLTDALFEVRPECEALGDYFPERTVARFLAKHGERSRVFGLDQRGVEQVRKGYEYLVRELELDAIVLIDGGTDILLRGDEQNLGTPVEDATSLAAVDALDVSIKLLACIGLGIDTYHGVCHAQWLENVAGLTREGAFFGACALVPSMSEAQFYVDAVNFADSTTKSRPSIVNGSIASAIEGYFGDHHRSQRTQSSKLFISPLMALLWMFDLSSVARRNLYLDRIVSSRTMQETALKIEEFHETAIHRTRTAIPY